VFINKFFQFVVFETKGYETHMMHFLHVGTHMYASNIIPHVHTHGFK
jgi:hypothetical protein